MNIKKDEFAIAVLLPLAVGTVAGYLTRGAQMMFSIVDKPPLSAHSGYPPDILRPCTPAL